MIEDVAENESPASKSFLRYDDPLVIGAGALLIGYAIGSGRVKWLSEETSKMMGNLGSLVLLYFSHSLQEHYPEYFRNEPRVTH